MMVTKTPLIQEITAVVKADVERNLWKTISIQGYSTLTCILALIKLHRILLCQKTFALLALPGRTLVDWTNYVD